MASKSFKESNAVAKDFTDIQGFDNKNPLDRQDLNPLALHDAKLDNQYAWRKWIDMLNSNAESNQKKSFILKKLLENPTVDFTKLWGRQLIGFWQVIDLGDLDNFKILYDKLERYVNPVNLAEYAAEKRQLEILKYLLEGKRVLDRPNSDHFLVQLGAAKSGDLKIVEYLFDDFKFLDGKKIEIGPRIQYKAAESGDVNVLEYIFDKYEASLGTKFPINPSIQYYAAISGNAKVLKYIFDKYEVSYGTKFPINPIIQYDAATSGYLDVLKYLIDGKGVSINYKQIMDGAHSARSSDPNYMTNVLIYLHEKGMRDYLKSIEKN